MNNTRNLIKKRLKQLPKTYQHRFNQIYSAYVPSSRTKPTLNTIVAYIPPAELKHALMLVNGSLKEVKELNHE